MNANSKKLLSLLIVVAMVLAMSPVITLSASAATMSDVSTWITNNDASFKEAETHEGSGEVATSCPVCGASSVTWTAINTFSDVETAGGHYFFYKDAEVGSKGGQTPKASGCVYLNDHSVINTGTGANRRAVEVPSDVTLNIIGNGEISTKGANTGNYGTLIVATGSTLNLYGGTYSSNGSADNNVVRINGGALNIYGGTVEGKFSNNGGTVAITGGTFNVDPTEYVDTTSYNVAAAGSTWTVSAKSAASAAFEVVDGTVATPYTDAAEAVAAATGNKYIKVLAADQTLDLNGGSVYVDCNGYNVTVKNGTLKGFDSTDVAAYSGTGSWVVDDTVTVEPANMDGNRYVTLKDGTAAKSYCFKLNISAVSLRTSVTGLYYKTTLECSDELAGKVEAYGVVLSLDSMPDSTWESSPKPQTAATCITESITLVNGKATFTSGILKNIMVTGNAENAERGNAPIYANAYLQFDYEGNGYDTNEAYVMAVADSGEEISYSMTGVMSAINENWASYAEQEGAQQRVHDFYNTWATEMGWDLADIAGFTAA